MYTFKAGQRQVWDYIKKLLKVDPTARKLAAIAYYSDGEILKFSAGDIVVIDASDGAISYGQTRKEAVHCLVDSAEVYSSRYLHAKVLVIGKHLITGSMNASQSSQYDLAEAALITDNPSAVSDAIDWITGLAKKSKRVDEAFLKRMARIEVKQRPRSFRTRPQRKKRIVTAPDIETANWFYFVLTPFKRDLSDSEENDAEAAELTARYVDDRQTVKWMRFNERHEVAARLRLGDRVILADRPHARSDRRSVMPYGRIVAVKRKKKSRSLVIHYAVPDDADSHVLSWKKFQAHLGPGYPPISLKTKNKELRDKMAIATLVENWPI